jgi:hypothetical protein
MELENNCVTKTMAMTAKPNKIFVRAAVLNTSSRVGSPANNNTEFIK